MYIIIFIMSSIIYIFLIHQLNGEDKWGYGRNRIYQEVKGWWERKEL